MLTFVAGISEGAIVAAAQIAGNSSTLTCNKPTGTASGDVMIAWHGNDFGTYSSLTAPAGWTQLTGLDRGTDTMHLKIWTKTAGGSEASTYGFPQGSGNDGCVVIVTLRNVNPSTGTWLWSTPVWAADSQTRTAPSVSGAGPGAVLLCSTLADASNTANTWTPPSGMTEQGDVQSQNAWATLTVASLLGPANPSGTKVFTASQNSWWASNGGIEWSVVVPAA